MPFLLRLPDALDAQVRDKAQSLGISINALLCVAADAYLRGGIQAPPVPPDLPQAPSPVVVQAIPESAPKPVAEPALPKLSKAERREITRLQRLQRK